MTSLTRPALNMTNGSSAAETVTAGSRVGVSPAPWAVAVLQKLGYPLTATKLYAMDLWSQQEGTQGNGGIDLDTGQPRYNWINSTLPVNGSTNCGSCTQGDIQDYPDFNTGVSATAQTIQGWPIIAAAFKANSSLTQIFTAINTSAPGPCAEKGCAETGNTTYPLALYQALGSAVPSYSVPASSSGATQGAASSAASSTGGCNAYVSKNSCGGNCVICLGGFLDIKACLLNRCQAKALLGGLAVLGGGVLALAGVVVIVATGLGGKGPVASTVRELGEGGAVGYVVGRVQSRRTQKAADDEALAKAQSQESHRIYKGKTVPAPRSIDEEKEDERLYREAMKNPEPFPP